MSPTTLVEVVSNCQLASPESLFHEITSRLAAPVLLKTRAADAEALVTDNVVLLVTLPVRPWMENLAEQDLKIGTLKAKRTRIVLILHGKCPTSMEETWSGWYAYVYEELTLGLRI